MKKLFVALLLSVVFIAAGPARAAYAYVNDAEGADQTGTAIDLLATSSALSTTAGNLIVVVVQYYYTTTDTGTFTVTDGSNTYVEATTAHTVDSSDASAIRVFYAVNIAGGSVTPTIHFPNFDFNYVYIAAAQYSGLATTSPLLGAIGQFQTTGASGTGTDAVTSTATAISSQPAAVLGFVYFDASADGPAVAGTGFTRRAVFWNAAEGALEDQRVTATGSYAATFTKNGHNNGFSFAVVVMFAESGGGPPPGPPASQFFLGSNADPANRRRQFPTSLHS